MPTGNRQNIADKFQNLAALWEDETVLLSNSAQATEHPAHLEIIAMGEPAVPLILERMQSRGGHWLHALGQITGIDPVAPDDRGNIDRMQQSWLEWDAQQQPSTAKTRVCPSGKP